MHQQTLPIPQRFRVVNPAPVLEALSAHPARTAGPDAAPSQNVYEGHYGGGFKVWDKFEVIRQEKAIVPPCEDDDFQSTTIKNLPLIAQPAQQNHNIRLDNDGQKYLLTKHP